MNYKRIRHEVLDAIANDALGEYIDQNLEGQDSGAQYRRRFIQVVANRMKRMSPADRRPVIELLLSRMRIDDLTEEIVKLAVGSKAPLKSAASFKVSLSMRSRRAQLGGLSPEWSLNNKIVGYKFADLLGVRRAKSLAENVSFSAVRPQRGIVLKPSSAAGTIGVYLVQDLDSIVDLARKEVLGSWEELQARVEQDLASRRVTKDSWLVQEAIFDVINAHEPARDMRIYCFYGAAHLVQETSGRGFERRDCWWDRSGTAIRTGIHDKRWAKGVGLDAGELELAEAISAKIPAPFIRIDFLKAKQGLIFNEFSPRPGNFEKFDHEVDQVLGDAYLDADGRLMTDLYQGKRFSEFDELVGPQSARRRKGRSKT